MMKRLLSKLFFYIGSIIGLVVFLLTILMLFLIFIGVI